MISEWQPYSSHEVTEEPSTVRMGEFNQKHQIFAFWELADAGRSKEAEQIVWFSSLKQFVNGSKCRMSGMHGYVVQCVASRRSKPGLHILTPFVFFFNYECHSKRLRIWVKSHLRVVLSESKRLSGLADWLWKVSRKIPERKSTSRVVDATTSSC